MTELKLNVTDSVELQVLNQGQKDDNDCDTDEQYMEDVMEVTQVDESDTE